MWGKISQSKLWLGRQLLLLLSLSLSLSSLEGYSTTPLQSRPWTNSKQCSTITKPSKAMISKKSSILNYNIWMFRKNSMALILSTMHLLSLQWWHCGLPAPSSCSKHTNMITRCILIGKEGIIFLGWHLWGLILCWILCCLTRYWLGFLDIRKYIK